MNIQTPIRGIAEEFLQLKASGDDSPAVRSKQLAEALNLPWPLSGPDEAALCVASDMGITPARIVVLESPTAADRDPDTVRQWRLAAQNESGVPAIIIPVAPDIGRPAYKPGEVPLSLRRLGMRLFLDSIVDLVAIPLSGRVALSLTGMTIAVGSFLATERGELVVYATGLAWLRAHLDRARTVEAELPSHLVADALDGPEKFCTLILEPGMIEWRPQRISCPLPPGVKSIIVRDSAGLANLIDGKLRQRDRPPPRPQVYGPKTAGAA